MPANEALLFSSLGINNLRAYFNKLERDFKNSAGSESADAADYMKEADEILATDALVQSLVVQRSRSYAKESQIQETGSATIFPKRLPPKVAEYSIRNTYGALLDIFVKAFSTKKPLFNLPIYFTLAWYTGPDENIDPLDEGRQKQVVALIRTNFLKFDLRKLLIFHQ